MRRIFEKKVAFVTGAGSGIGRATACRFAAQGAHVVVVDRDSAAGGETARLIDAAGETSAFVACDVTDEGQVATAVAFAVDRCGGLDIAFNNAGIGGSKGVPTDALGLDEWLRIITVNLTSVFLCMKHELAHMAPHGGGVIINTSSTAGLAAAANSGVAYAASKHGVIGLTRTAAKEYLDRGVRVNAICPAGVATPLLQRTIGEAAYAAAAGSARIASADAVADAVLALASPAGAGINGQAIVLDGGRTL